MLLLLKNNNIYLYLFCLFIYSLFTPTNNLESLLLLKSTAFGWRIKIHCYYVVIIYYIATPQLTFMILISGHLRSVNFDLG